MSDIEKELKALKDEVEEIRRQLNPGNSPGIAGELSDRIGRLAKRVEKIEKKLGISN
jgi:archaellum component FlaC